MKKYDLHAQFDHYLKLSGLSEQAISEVQYRETKRAFMGAASQMLLMFRDDIGGIEDEDTAVEVMENLFKQVSDFWTAERND